MRQHLRASNGARLPCGNLGVATLAERWVKATSIGLDWDAHLSMLLTPLGERLTWCLPVAILPIDSCHRLQLPMRAAKCASPLGASTRFLPTELALRLEFTSCTTYR